MTNVYYRRGYYFEWYVKRKLDARGYKTARSAGSHTEFDLYVIMPYEQWLSKIRLGLHLLGLDNHICDMIIKLLKDNPPVIGVQCKKGGHLKRQEREEMIKSSEKYPIIPLLAYSKRKRVKFKDVRDDREVEV